MRIAVEGCAHGELESIYETIKCIEKKENYKIDLLLCCGDFQSTRNLSDLHTMAVPQKYLDICTFYKYYSGELLAPVLTIFVGGNHEASNYLQELPYGGWVAPNIYYLGYAGVVRVNGIRIGGLSGIQKGQDYLRGHFEFAPYTDSTKRSVYHVRQLEVFRLKQLSGKINIFMSHDWPNGIYNYGNKSQLLRFKPHFAEDIDNERLGSKPCMELLLTLKPTYWFAAHLHCKFAALVPHNGTEHDVPNTTKFLALDKCLPRRRFLQICDIDSIENVTEGEIKLEYDLEWLTILHLTNHLLCIKQTNHYLPGPSVGDERYNFTPTREEMNHVLARIDGDLSIPKNFCRTVEAHNPSDIPEHWMSLPQPKAHVNPQTTRFCDLLGLDDPVSLAMLINGEELNYSRDLDETVASVDASLINDSLVNTSCCESESNITLNNIEAETSLQAMIEIDEQYLHEEEKEEKIETEEKVDKDEKEENEEKLLKEEQEDVKHDIKIPDMLNLSTENEPENTNTIDEVPIKKFKRRNQDIYSEKPEDAEIFL